jgi:hypothetical protein
MNFSKGVNLVKIKSFYIKVIGLTCSYESGHNHGRMTGWVTTSHKCTSQRFPMSEEIR